MNPSRQEWEKEVAYERVVVALDVASEAAESVIERARQVCRAARVTAIHVVDESYLHYGDEVSIPGIAAMHERLSAESAGRLASLSEAGGIAEHVLLRGHAANEIHRYAEEQGADAIVMGAHGRHGWRLLLGSTANAVLHGAKCDVLCVHIPETPKPYRRVLAAVDSTQEARHVVETAVAIASRSGAEVSLMSAVRPLEHSYAGMDVTGYGDSGLRFVAAAEAQLQGHLDNLAERYGTSGERILRRGHPAQEIHLLAAEMKADLVVLGTHGRHGFALLLGSTANAVLHDAKTDVLAVRVGL